MLMESSLVLVNIYIYACYVATIFFLKRTNLFRNRSFHIDKASQFEEDYFTATCPGGCAEAFDQGLVYGTDTYTEVCLTQFCNVLVQKEISILSSLLQFAQQQFTLED